MYRAGRTRATFYNVSLTMMRLVVLECSVLVHTSSTHTTTRPAPSGSIVRPSVCVVCV